MHFRCYNGPGSIDGYSFKGCGHAPRSHDPLPRLTRSLPRGQRSVENEVRSNPLPDAPRGSALVTRPWGVLRMQEGWQGQPTSSPQQQHAVGRERCPRRLSTWQDNPPRSKTPSASLLPPRPGLEWPRARAGLSICFCNSEIDTSN